MQTRLDRMPPARVRFAESHAPEVDMRRQVCSLAILALALVGLDLAVGAAVRGSGLAGRTADLQHPTALMCRLHALRAVPHPKVVLLGDSLVYGGVLADHGDPDWRAHGLDEYLAAESTGVFGRRPTVVNLGMNGALPADLECLAPLVAACDVDWVVLDVHLRPFSADFSPADRQMSRPWLRELAADAAGRVSWRPAAGGTVRLSAHAADYSAVARCRALVQDNLLSTRVVAGPVLRPPAARSETDAEVQELVRLAQLKNRLRALDLGPDGPQVLALQRLLRDLSARGQRHVVFYAKENPALLPDVMDPEEHAGHYERLIRLIGEAQGPAGVFVPPAADLGPEHYLDLTHLTADGYQVLARRLAAAFR